jgi:fused signal recognition particle receptor
MSDDPRSAEELDAPPERPARRGFFAKVKRGLFMTHTEILEKLGTAVKQSLGIDESVLEALEEALLAADVGADTASALTEAVRQRANISERKDLAHVRTLLAEEIEKLLASAPRAAGRTDAPLFVTFLVGVNGSGKTTTTAKLAARAKSAGRPARAPSTSFRPGPTAWTWRSSGTRRAPIPRPCSSTLSPRRRLGPWGCSSSTPPAGCIRRRT